jgi:hypothetical protein|tara:strand:+ start:551 stop:703 length:153 start_codon:yes stop_codon:yes gene_type:complete
MSEGSDEVKRWTARRQAVVVLDIIKGKPTAVETAPGNRIWSLPVKSVIPD